MTRLAKENRENEIKKAIILNLSSKEVNKREVRHIRKQSRKNNGINGLIKKHAKKAAIMASHMNERLFLNKRKDGFKIKSIIKSRMIADFAASHL